ncbi:MAG TPA: STM4012 family radical SAM protein [Verrucomicrobiae bacterium]
MNSFEQFRRAGAFQGYAYGYPHKTAYRKLQPAIPLREMWRDEDTSALFLYLHIPFCEMRCGFCNLFTTSDSSSELMAQHFAAMRRQAKETMEALGPDAKFARIAIGGGTPSILPADALEDLLRFVSQFPFAGKPLFAVEVSPATVTREKLDLLKAAGATRVSIGVQSFDENETRALGRSQKRDEVENALAMIRDVGFAARNIDLIYGIAGQTNASWMRSLRRALDFQPDELYLYPLYVRPLTLLGRRGEQCEEDKRLEFYRTGRELLLEAGYQQISMRLFRKGAALEGPVYCCQEDGMIGIGAGARSYASALHYSTEWAVSFASVKEIIRNYIATPQSRFRFAEHGIELSLAEQRRRYVVKSVLRREGLDLTAYRARFRSHAIEDFPELLELIEAGCLEDADGCLLATPLGFELSDAIGPWLYSNVVVERMNSYALT